MHTYASSGRLWVLWLIASLIAVAAVPSTFAAETEATSAIEKWLKIIDAGEYAKSWKEASTDFQKAVTEEKWVGAMNAVRVPLGKCESRQLASALHQTEVPTPTGEIIKGDFVIAQFETAFENLKYAVETVTFVKEGGTWKASGYYVKPKV